MIKVLDVYKVLSYTDLVCIQDGTKTNSESNKTGEKGILAKTLQKRQKFCNTKNYYRL